LATEVLTLNGNQWHDIMTIEDVIPEQHDCQIGSYGVDCCTTLQGISSVLSMASSILNPERRASEKS
jgi:hypothetical protein